MFNRKSFFYIVLITIILIVVCAFILSNSQQEQIPKILKDVKVLINEKEQETKQKYTDELLSFSYHEDWLLEKQQTCGSAMLNNMLCYKLTSPKYLGYELEIRVTSSEMRGSRTISNIGDNSVLIQFGETYLLREGSINYNNPSDGRPIIFLEYISDISSYKNSDTPIESSNWFKVRNKSYLISYYLPINIDSSIDFDVLNQMDSIISTLEIR